MRKETEQLDKGRKKPRPPGKKGKKDQGVQGGEDPKKPRVIHPWSTELKEVFLKPITESNYHPLYRLCGYCGCTKETLVPDMDAKDFQQYLIIGKCIFGKS